MSNNTIITIDGPAGSGKSTVAARLAQKLGIAYLDTGAMYRAVTLAALQRGVPLDNGAELARMVSNCHIEITDQPNTCRVWLDGRDVTEAIRSSEVTDQSHNLARLTKVREQLVRQQQAIARKLGSLVTEGRDQGTVVFPQANFKFYLDATPECRAKRRWNQLQANGADVNYDKILAAQKLRDQRDQSRTIGPLKPAPDAHIIDTTDMTIEQVVETLYQRVSYSENLPTEKG